MSLPYWGRRIPALCAIEMNAIERENSSHKWQVWWSCKVQLQSPAPLKPSAPSPCLRVAPVKGDGRGKEDNSRDPATGLTTDYHRFRASCAMSRRWQFTGTWGLHDTFVADVRQHIDLVALLFAYDPAQLGLLYHPDLARRAFSVLQNPAVVAIASEHAPTRLTEGDICQIFYFLRALAGPGMLDLCDTVPESVRTSRRGSKSNWWSVERATLSRSSG